MSRRAAAVPASKAQIGKIYAIQYEGKLNRFCVSRVTTHRTADNGGPADYESEILGYLHPQGTKLTIEPKQLLGFYDQYVELVAQREKEEGVRKAEERHRKDQAEKLVRLLYDATGIAKPNDKFRSPFRVSYGSSEVGINSYEAIDKMIEVLEGRK